MSTKRKKTRQSDERRAVWVRRDLHALIEVARKKVPIQDYTDDLIESALRQRRVLPPAAAPETTQPAA